MKGRGLCPSWWDAERFPMAVYEFEHYTYTKETEDVRHEFLAMCCLVFRQQHRSRNRLCFQQFIKGGPCCQLATNASMAAVAWYFNWMKISITCHGNILDLDAERILLKLRNTQTASITSIYSGYVLFLSLKNSRGVQAQGAPTRKLVTQLNLFQIID